MKPKSMRLRFLKALYAFWKHTDKDHKLNLKTLNSRFLPPELSFLSPRALSETLDAMREFGLDVQRTGRGSHDGIWVENRPLSDWDIYALNFAVSTNPYLSKENAENILHSLKPFVTVYQEPLLEVYAENDPADNIPTESIDIFGAIHNAIRTMGNIRFRIYSIDPTDNSWVPMKILGRSMLFTPGRICEKDGALYVTGYNHTLKKHGVIDLRDIAWAAYEPQKK